ncbi:MAG: aminotransferase class III-fold pyridoxal phosphate-dependent enzyme [Vicinamibacterales bacterium]
MAVLIELGAAVVAGAALWPAAAARLALSRAKHPSLAGHARLSRWMAGQVARYDFDADTFFTSDGAPADVATARRNGLARLGGEFREQSPTTIAATEALADGVSDLQFTRAYRVPFPYAHYLSRHLTVGALLARSEGGHVVDPDGRASFDLSGSYGVNLLGYDAYKDCIDEGTAAVRDLGPVLGAYHPAIREVVDRLRAISGLDEVSFHMSGTEAVMQAVRLARYHTGRSHLVRFCGAYHGWWDDVQPGVGTPRRVDGVYTLRDMHARTLHVLRTRRDIACVLVNPLQALHPNQGAPADNALVAGRTDAAVTREAYAAWLRELRTVCTERGIVLIFDEVFLGFRLARGGAQEFFGVRADLVTYGKTLGGGLPVGVLCGRRDLMRRFRDDRPVDICFARGTFNTHPYVLGAMRAFLRRLDEPRWAAAYDGLEATWRRRADALNARLAERDLPVRVANLVSVWTVCYPAPSRYNWMFQFYLRAEGLALSWVGSGRFIFSHACTDAEFDDVAERFVRAARRCLADGWWWTPPGASHADVQRAVLREMLAARVRSTAAHRAAWGTIGSKRSPRST